MPTTGIDYVRSIAAVLLCLVMADLRMAVQFL